MAFKPLGPGRTSIGVRQNRVSWFKGRIPDDPDHAWGSSGAAGAYAQHVIHDARARPATLRRSDGGIREDRNGMLEHQHRYQHLNWNAIHRRTDAGAPTQDGRRRQPRDLSSPTRASSAVHQHPHEQMTLVEAGAGLFTIEGARRIARTRRGPSLSIRNPSPVRRCWTKKVVLMDIFRQFGGFLKEDDGDSRPGAEFRWR